MEGRFDPHNFVAYAQDAIVNDKNRHVVVYITPGERGYYETTYTGDLEYALKTADAINETLGHTREHVLEVVATSLREQNR